MELPASIQAEGHAFCDRDGSRADDPTALQRGRGLGSLEEAADCEADVAMVTVKATFGAGIAA